MTQYITGSYTDQDMGLTLSEAVVVVGQLRANLTEAHFDVSFYADLTAYQTQKQQVTSKNYFIPTASITDGVDSLYAHLLTLPEFTDFTIVA